MSDTYDHGERSATGGPADPRELISGSAPDDMPEPSCSLVIELLPEAVGGDLDVETGGIVSRHLSGCHSCLREWIVFRKAHEEMQSLRANVEELIDDEFFDGLHKDILGSLRFSAQELADARKLRVRGAGLPGRGRPGRSLVRVAAFAATLLFGMLVGTYVPGWRGLPEWSSDSGERGPLVRGSQAPLDVNQAVDLGSSGLLVPLIPDVTGSVWEALEDIKNEFGVRTQLQPELPVFRDF
ncbi:MAG: hypothetical protein ACE5F1_15125 [Planctomycetota bacterium]